ncbi:MAG: bifunctional phosphoribosylaminoimidazolecarboxamide formyltransferase/IMP cyclohydrolase, partial [bacterium]
MPKIKRALISVYDKTGIVEFARTLGEYGVEIISTGGTAKHLNEHGIETRAVSDVTEFPEILAGRVKTLHPRIFGGLLSLRDNPSQMREIQEHDIDLIDLVVINLYP